MVTLWTVHRSMDRGECNTGLEISGTLVRFVSYAGRNKSLARDFALLLVSEPVGYAQTKGTI